MLKRDPYNHKTRWELWKKENNDGIKGLSVKNSDQILSFLRDMEFGKNVSPVARKGERSHCRLLSLKSRMLFFARHLKDKPLDQISKEEIHQLFFDMRQGNIVRADKKSYMGVSYYVEDFKAFWGWLRRTGKVREDITTDLHRSDGRKPDWTYLTEEEFKTLASRAHSDYRVLMWLMYDTGMRVTEAYSIRIRDFSNDFTQLHIRKEYSKTFGRTVSLKLCPPFIREFVKFHNLQPEDFIFIKKPAAFNKYLRILAKTILGTAETPARKPYHKMRLYDIRHNASCYWLKRYPTTTGLMYRMGWSEEKEVKYYSEFLGQSDSIDDENMITSEEKTMYEKRIKLLETDRQKTNELVTELIKKIADMQISLKNEVQEKQIIPMEIVPAYSADYQYRSNL
jgi:integrase